MLSTWLGAIGVPPADAITGSGRNRGECLGGVRSLGFLDKPGSDLPVSATVGNEGWTAPG